jgi:hypothetical protein
MKWLLKKIIQLKNIYNIIIEILIMLNLVVISTVGTVKAIFWTVKAIFYCIFLQACKRIQ